MGFRDSLDADIAESMQDPTYRGAYEDEDRRQGLLVELTARRRAQGLTQAEVGRRMGVRQPFVSELEASSDPYLSTLQRYARAVDARINLTVVIDVIDEVKP